MQLQYLPKTYLGKFGHVLEEAGEVLQVLGKILRFGVMSYSPHDPNKTPNAQLLENEMDDFRGALKRFIEHKK